MTDRDLLGQIVFGPDGSTRLAEGWPLKKATDRIAELEAENKRLREALEEKA